MLYRFHGVFAPNSKHRAAVTSEGKEKQPSLPATTEPPAICEERRGKMSWAMRLKRVNIDVTVCRHCQGPVRIIACIEDRQVINKILAHINRKQEHLVSVMTGSGIRAPPTDSTFLMNQ